MFKLRNIALIAFGILFSLAVMAGDVEDGDAAFGKQDYVTALKKYKSAAGKNEVKSQIVLGFMYEEGLGVKQDYAEAVRWYKLAANQGNANAQANIGVIYSMGTGGVAQDYAEAVRWYKLSLTQGIETRAPFGLALSYANGQGVLQDYTRAHMWFNLASVKGDAIAVKNRDIIAKRMTSQQISEAQKLARECQSRNFKNCD